MGVAARKEKSLQAGGRPWLQKAVERLSGNLYPHVGRDKGQEGEGFNRFAPGLGAALVNCVILS